MTCKTDAGKTKRIKLHTCRVLSSPTHIAIAVWVKQKSNGMSPYFDLNMSKHLYSISVLYEILTGTGEWTKPHIDL